MLSTFAGVFLAALASAFIPALPVEGALLGAAATTDQGPLLLGLAAGSGQTLGKVLMLLALRGALRSEQIRRWLDRHRRKPTPGAAASTPEGGPGRRGWRMTVAAIERGNRRLLAGLDRPLLAMPIVLLSAALGFPPLLLTVFVVAPTRIPVTTFAVACFMGRTARFITVSLLPQLAHVGLPG
ncbi:hypothetical protein [Micromonospora sp. RTGN7]|uniref:hypothetical protein n=1 Tax=Micromonospora sp. RTGN7 TaxID=3016526 RepID=UPI0029FF1812|nr:hypothetical protein [Micromonospora sp. RTGN7]